VRVARDVVRDAVEGLDRDAVDRLLLCTSEVVTNAIEHGAPPIELTLASDGDVVRVEVSDGSDDEPRRTEPATMAIRGRGLLIVDKCSDRWGVARDSHGKTVWFEVAG
jgi:anti-sigma regulatory factor (Ser/Thr protein kinase)